MQRQNRTPHSPRAWYDLPFLIVGILLLIPLCFRIVEILFEFLADTRW